jgi:uncharacterized protein
MQASLLINGNRIHYLPRLEVDGRVETLANSTQNEVLQFLEERTLQLAYLTGLIRDNGLNSHLNRGTFYGYRNCLGQLEGVCLIGHAILMEAATDRALKAFAETAQRFKAAHMIMCEEDRFDKFWAFYNEGGQEMRRASRQLLFELRWPIEVPHRMSKLRLATVEDLPLLIPAHAEMALEQSGMDPRETDEAGFANRYARRVWQGRTWVLTEDKKLIFKADVVTEGAEATYIEGVWVNPDSRRQGHGRRCMAQLARMLLWRTKAVTLLVDDENEEAQRFYRQVGYHQRKVYDTIFLK